MILRLIDIVIESFSIYLPIFLLAGVLGLGGFIYYNNREKTICSKKICRLEKKLERLKTKLYDFDIAWLFLISIYQYI